MPDPQTPNLQLYIPARGADPGTWDTPVNFNSNALDAALGQTTTVAITNVNVALSPAQYQCGTIVFTGNQTGDVTITFPAFGRMYNIFNNCTNNNTWIINLGIAAGVVCAPPGELTTVFTDGVNFFYLGMGPIGSYFDYAGNAVPRWISSCTVPPFLHADGSVFNAITYPVLNTLLGGNTLPDTRGRFRATLNEGTARLTGAGVTGGVDGDTFLATGGNQTFARGNIPNFALPVTDPSHLHGFVGNTLLINAANYNSQSGDGSISGAQYGGVLGNTSPALTGISVNSGGSGNAYSPPAYIGGITFVRAG